MQFFRKAYDLRDRASEREKFYILSHYYGEATGQIDKAIEIYEQWIRTYHPRHDPLRQSCARHSQIGQYEKALNAASEALRLDPKDSYAYQNVAAAYLKTDPQRACLPLGCPSLAHTAVLTFFVDLLFLVVPKCRSSGVAVASLPAPSLEPA
jgi:tetratricopeptide (TPR) repeat protein